MKRLDLNRAIRAMGGDCTNPVCSVVSGISTDTRSLNQGDLYFALYGDNFDGHQFVDSALQKGASGAVVSRLSGINRPGVITVDDPLAALQKLAAFYRTLFNIPVVAITGSHGKTTTKDITDSILKTRWIVHKTHENLNGLIGVPLTLLQLDETHQAAVIEIGVSKPGEMDVLAPLVRPIIAVLTCISESHLEFMNDLQTIAYEKSRLFYHMQSPSSIIINAEDPWIPKVFPHHIVRQFGVERGEIRGQILSNEPGLIKFLLIDGMESRQMSIPLSGRHNLANALAAIAVAKVLGFSYEEAAAGLRNFTISPHRSDLIDLGWRMIDDSYNAAPQSMKAALNMLNEMDIEGRKFAVLGDMLELGKSAQKAHEEIGDFINGLNLDEVILFGPLMKYAKSRIENTRMKIVHFESYNNIAQYIRTFIKRDDAVLFKASHGMKAYLVCQDLIKNPGVL